MNFKTGDKVVVISGKDKGKEGTITHVLRSENRVVVEGVNIVKKHVKGNGQQAGSINEVEAPIHASNVMIVDPKTKKPTGGEGRAPVGHKGPLTPWGKPALGYKTRKGKKQSDDLIVHRRKK